MATADSVKAKLQGLIDKSNATTGNTDADLTTAVDALVAGYGQGGLDGYFAVNFYNDDRTTLLYTVYVPSGSSAIYAGETPISTVDVGYSFAGFEPAAVNVTADMDCYAVYDEVGKLDKTTWEQISKLSADGMAQNYFAVGDTKMIHIEGTVVTLDVNGDYGVYILGFNHNSELEGNGITFGTFKTDVSNGTDICLIDSVYGKTTSSSVDGFSYNLKGNNRGGWAGSDIRYGILGSTDNEPDGYQGGINTNRVGKEPSPTCATQPVANTLMAALPDDLRAVMKPMTKYTNNVGMSGDAEDMVTISTDYLPLLAEFEVYGSRVYANSYEQNKQKQYDYFVAGNSKVKNRHTDHTIGASWHARSPESDGQYTVLFGATGRGSGNSAFSYGLAPIFKV